MLEQLRRNSRSWLIWFIFAIIILAFVLFFGPQSGPEMFGCSGSASTVVEVGDEDVNVHSWRFAMNGRGFGAGGGSGPQAGARRAAAIDFLVERELLAQEAERAGFLVSEDQVVKALAAGDFYITGLKVDGKQIYFDEGYFSAEILERYSNQLGMPSVDYLVDEQKREHLADITRDMLLGSVWVSDEEARADYIHRNTTITADYLVFKLSDYAAKLQLSEADARSWLADHEAEAKAEWEKEKAQFATPKERVQVRHIMLAKDAKELADKTAARIKGGESFADVAAEVSTDERTRYRGGSLGWRSASALGYGTAVVEAVKNLKPGEVSGIVEGPRGLHILELDERSSEPLTFDQRKLDIAFKLAGDFFARKLARRDAEAALASIADNGGDQKLEDVFERKAAPPSMPQLPDGLTPEQKRMIEEQMRKQLQESIEGVEPMPQPGATPADPGGAPQDSEEPAPDQPKNGSESGWIYREGPIILAQAGGGKAPPTPAQPQPEPARAGPAPISAEPAPAAAGGSDLPKIDIEPPKLEKIGPAPRPADSLAGIGRSPKLVTALFETLSEGEVAGEVFEVEDPDAFVVVQLIDRAEADLDRYEDVAEETRQRLELVKQIEILTRWIRTRCEAAAKAGSIGVNTSYLVYDDDKPPFQYSACSNIGEQTVFEQLQTRRGGFGFF
jgi:parvulin-like peptidyl-prolyl isomerase